jgi:DNA invertase Pin-like site-specific DNA recombinase
MKEGKRVSPSVPYGYLRDPNDKQKLVIDPEPAAVVKRIFRLVMEGKGVAEIANILYEDNVLIPSAYAEIYNPENNHSNGFQNPVRWSPTAVTYILEKQEYMGHTVMVSL